MTQITQTKCSYRRREDQEAQPSEVHDVRSGSREAGLRLPQAGPSCCTSRREPESLLRASKTHVRGGSCSIAALRAAREPDRESVKSHLCHLRHLWLHTRWAQTRRNGSTGSTGSTRSTGSTGSTGFRLRGRRPLRRTSPKLAVKFFASDGGPRGRQVLEVPTIQRASSNAPRP
jgi:hypothetical protein